MLSGFTLAARLAGVSGSKISGVVACRGDLSRAVDDAKELPAKSHVAQVKRGISRRTLAAASPPVRYLLAAALSPRDREALWDLLRNLPEPRPDFRPSPALRRAVESAAALTPLSHQQAVELAELRAEEATWHE